MKVIQCYCDVCGKEMKNDNYDNRMYKIMKRTFLRKFRSKITINDAIEMDICDMCYDNIIHLPNKRDT